MNFLEGTIAFAVTMAGLATVCTVLIEVLHRLLRLRASGLRHMLAGFFDKVLLPKLTEKTGQQRQDEDVDRLRDHLIGAMVNNPLQEHLVPQNGPGSWLSQLFDTPLVEHTRVTTEEFLRRLPETEWYQLMGPLSAAEATALLAEVADKYDQYGEAISDYFKRRAQALSLLMGVVLAFSLNIHGGRMFEEFVRNRDLAQRLTAQADQLDKWVNNGNTSSLTPDNAAAIRSDLSTIRRKLTAYEDSGLPVGWGYYPNCLSPTATDPGCGEIVDHIATEKRQQAGKLQRLGAQADGTLAEQRDVTAIPRHIMPLGGSFIATANADWPRFLGWLVTVTLTGFLIGLGGPFWFDIAMKFSTVKQAITDGKPSAPQDTATAVAPAGPSARREQLIRQIASQTEAKQP